MFINTIYITHVHRVHHSFPTRRSSDLHNPSASCFSVSIFCSASRPFSPKSNCGFFSAPSLTNASNGRPSLLRKRSEEHTSELQSRPHLVCRLLLEKKNNYILILFTIN